jgi:hypothetical protein
MVRPATEVFVKQDMFVDVEQGYSEHNLKVLNKAVDAFAEFDPLVARVLHLSQQGSWPREFTLATIAYYVLHRQKDGYHGSETRPDVPVPPVRITVNMEPITLDAMQSLLKIVQNHPPMASGDDGQSTVCAFCRQKIKSGHEEDCQLRRAISQAEHLLRVA